MAGLALTGRSSGASLDASDRDAFSEWAINEGVAGLLLHAAPDWIASMHLRDRMLAASRARVAMAAAEEHELRGVLQACAGAGVRPILLKGAALAYTLYPDPSLRPRRDTDVLIRDDDEPVMRDVLERLGYTPPLAPPGRTIRTQFCYARSHGGIRHVWDIHLRISNVHAYADRLTYADLRADAISIATLDGVLAPSHVHSSILACLHRVAHHGQEDELLWLIDIHLLGGALSQADRQRLVAIARQTQLSQLVVLGLTRAAEIFGPVFPDDALAELQRAAATEAPQPLISGQLKTIDVLAADLASIGWRARIGLLREHLIPPRSYMKERYGRWPTALLPIAYIYRIVRGSAGWFRSSTFR